MIGRFIDRPPAQVDQEDVFGGNYIQGDDAHEFLEDFAARYGVDLSGFLTYFHYIGDEPPSYRRIVPVDQKGEVLPFAKVSVAMLAKAAQSGRWTQDYPKHSVTSRTFRRSAWWVFWIVLAIAAGWLAASFWGQDPTAPPFTAM